MLLTVAPPMQNDIKPPLSYSNYKSSNSRYSPPESPRTLPPVFDGHDSRMNNPHRGLPPPVGMSLAPPERGFAVAQPLGSLPAPPAQWTGHDESMRHWLQAKAEEDRRKQEEERTKQETLRLDQRRIEQNMLRESLQGGVPAPMVPLIFAGMGGGNLPVHTLEWAQQYMASLSLQNQQQQQQIQAQQQQLQQHHQQPPQPMSPDLRRDSRMIPPNPYGGHQPLQPALTQSQNQSQLLPVQTPSSSVVTLGGATPTGSVLPAALSRINTGTDVQRQALQPLPQMPGSQSEPQQQAPQSGSGPSLFFHHWTPPNNSNNAPPTPNGGKSNQGSPFSQHPPSHLRSEYQNSPKKRKTAGGHPVPAAPTSQPSDPQTAHSSRSSREREASPGQHSRPRNHSRQYSDASSYERETRHVARPSSRQRRQEEFGGPGDGPKRQLTGASIMLLNHESSARHDHVAA